MDGEPLAGQFAHELFGVVNKYRDQGLSIPEALGTLDLVHGSILKDSLQSEDGENEE